MKNSSAKEQGRKILVLTLICALLSLFLWTGATKRIQTVADDAPSIGIRYKKPTVQQSALEKLRLEQERTQNALAIAGYLAWEENGELELSDTLSGRLAKATRIDLNGEGTLLIPAQQYITGNPPAEGDSSSIAMSEKMGLALFGTTQLVGQPVYKDEKEYVICGVFRNATENIVLIQHERSDNDFNYSAMEISRIPNASGVYPLASEQAKSFFDATLLPSGQSVLDYQVTVSFLRLLATLPTLLLTIILLIRTGMSCGHVNGWPAKLVYAGFMILSAAICVWSLSGWMFWPQDWLPSSWSYFEFWGQRWQTLNQQLEGVFSLPAGILDLARRKEELAAFLGIVGALFLVFPAASFRKGTIQQYALCALISLLGVFGLSVWRQIGFVRAVWMGYLIFYVGMMLLRMLEKDFPFHNGRHRQKVSRRDRVAREKRNGESDTESARHWTQGDGSDRAENLLRGSNPFADDRRS